MSILQIHAGLATPPTLGFLTAGEQTANDRSLSAQEHVRAVYAGVWGMARATRAERGQAHIVIDGSHDVPAMVAVLTAHAPLTRRQPRCALRSAD